MLKVPFLCVMLFVIWDYFKPYSKRKKRLLSSALFSEAANV